MERKKVISSNINSIGYDKDNCLLEVEFYKGEIHQYHPVEPKTYEGLMEAESIGSYFSKNIRSNKFIRSKKMG